MTVPVVLATVAACGSLVTSLKSGWELRRMIKRKQEERECDEEAPYVFRRLRRAYYEGLMNSAEYEHWYEKFLLAKVEKDCEWRPFPNTACPCSLQRREV
jgi:ribosome assembly protein 4